jgi:hypothetical protein
MDTTRQDAIERAERDMDGQLKTILRLDGSAPVGKRNSAEVLYGEAYQQLVELGARPQLKRKYRSGAHYKT